PVRARLLRPAPDPQERAEHPVVAGVRRAAGRALALRLARRPRRRLDADGDGAAGAGVLRQQVRTGTGAAKGLGQRIALPAVDARPDGLDRGAAVDHVVAVIGGGGEAGVVGQDQQAAADGKAGVLDGADAADDAVLLGDAVHVQT